jgi:hypothetical protein
MGHLPRIPDMYQKLKRLEQEVSDLAARLKQEREP